MMGRQGQVTRLRRRREAPDADVARRWRRRIEAKVAGRRGRPGARLRPGDIQIRLAKTMAWATIGVALVLGSVGVLNTMVMAVFERTGEIGLLRALGWRRRRVLALILGEAAGPRAARGGRRAGRWPYVGVRALILLADVARVHRPEPAARVVRDRAGAGRRPEPARRPLPGAPGVAARPDRGAPP